MDRRQFMVSTALGTGATILAPLMPGPRRLIIKKAHSCGMTEVPRIQQDFKALEATMGLDSEGRKIR